jgi:hypothetical protein
MANKATTEVAGELSPIVLKQDTLFAYREYAVQPNATCAFLHRKGIPSLAVLGGILVRRGPRKQDLTKAMQHTARYQPLA